MESRGHRLICRRVVTPDGCWILDGYGDRSWYCQIRINRVYYRVHRLAAELWVDGWDQSREVLHACDRPACYNPEHLFLGTQVDNVRDMHMKGRGRSVLKPEQVREIRVSLNLGDSIETVAKRYGVGFTAIWRIREGISWQGMDLPANR